MNSGVRVGRWAVAAAGLAMLVAGCGGGGGSDDNDDNGNDPAPPNYKLKGSGIDTLGFTTIELGALYARIAADAILAAQKNDLAPRVDTCDQGGTRTLTYSDMDGDGRVSADDELRIDYVNCIENVIGGAENGAIIEQIQLPVNSGLSNAIEATVDFENYHVSDAANDLVISGGFRVSYGHDDDDTHADIVQLDVTDAITFAASGQDTTFGLGYETVIRQTSDFAANTYDIEPDGFVVIDQTGSVDRTEIFFSDIAADGSADATDITGTFAKFPTHGAVQFVDSNGVGTECVLTTGDDSQHVAIPSAPATRFSNGEPHSGVPDCLADATTRSTTPWSDLLSGALFANNDVFNLRGSGSVTPFGPPQAQ